MKVIARDRPGLAGVRGVDSVDAWAVMSPDGRFLAAVGDQAPPPVSVPVGFTSFPGEIWAAPRSWAETAYPGLAYYNAVDRGGHFAAWEEPALFTSELRAAFSKMR